MVGFLGTLFIVRPGSDMLSWASLLALGTALCYSLYQIMTRKFSEDEDPLATLFYTAIVGCVALSLVVPFLWVKPSGVHLGLFLLLGTAGAVEHFLLIKALEARLGIVAVRIRSTALGDPAGVRSQPLSSCHPAKTVRRKPKRFRGTAKPESRCSAGFRLQPEWLACGIGGLTAR